MKTTLKKTINDFDESYVPNDKDVFDSSDLDIEKITRNVKLRIASESEPRRKNKRLPIMLAAAAVTTAIVGTTVIAANINENKKFNEVIKGESDALEVYDNDSFKFETSNRNLKADFLGILGDDNIAYAAIELSTKDGSALIDDGYVLFNQEITSNNSLHDYELYQKSIQEKISTIDSDMSDNNYSFFENEPYSSISDPQDYFYVDGKYNEDFYNYWIKNGMSNGGEVLFTNSDNTENSIDSNIYYVPGDTPDKLKVYIRLENNDKNNSLSGTTVDYKSNYIKINKLGDVIGEARLIENSNYTGTCDIRDEYLNSGIDIVSMYVCPYDNFTTTYTAFYFDEKDDYPTMWDTSESETTFKLRKVDEIKKFDLSFNASFTIDKLTTDKTINIELNSENAPHTITGKNSIKLSITPFNARILTDNDENKLIFEKPEDLKEFDSAYAEIILKNGKKYYFDLHDDSYNFDVYDDPDFKSEENISVELYNTSIKYRDSLSPVENDLKKYFHNENHIEKETIIDPTNILKININGDTVYSAE